MKPVDAPVSELTQAFLPADLTADEQLSLHDRPRIEDWQFQPLVQGFRRSGGLCVEDELLQILRHKVSQPISVLARWIVDQRILSFTWRGHRWIPMFQFDEETMTPRPECEAIVRELRTVFDELELATWFVTPNASLGGAAPVENVKASRRGARCARRCLPSTTHSMRPPALEKQLPAVAFLAHRQRATSDGRGLAGAAAATRPL